MPQIKSLPAIERPREKLLRYGADHLTEEELIAILLRSGRHGENVLALARRLCTSIGLPNLPSITVEDLVKVKGIGATKACEMVACFELGKRLFQQKQSSVLLTPHDVWQSMADIRTSKKEHFVVFFLDARHQTTVREVITIGILDSNLVHPREVFEPAIRHAAACIILAHNHPSGKGEPSDVDIKTTHRLCEAGKILGIEVLDHVIVTTREYVSMKQEGMM